MFDRALKSRYEVRPERRIIADQLEPYAFFVERSQLALEVKSHETGKVCDFLGAAPPILGRKCVKGEDLDAVIGRRLHCSADGFSPSLVTGNARQAALFGPAAVAVHYDGDVPRYGARDFCAPVKSRRALGGGCKAHLPRISFSLAAVASSISLIVSSVSFCTSCSRRLRSSSLISCFFSSCFRWSMPSRRTLRTAIRAFSAYWPTSSGMGKRMTWPSTIGLMPRPALRSAFSTGCTFDLAQTGTDSIRGSGVETV